MNKTVKRCPNCRSVPSVHEGLVSCVNDPWCPVGNAMYTLEQWDQISRDPEAHGRVCTCGLKGNWCHIHNNPDKIQYDLYEAAEKVSKAFKELEDTRVLHGAGYTLEAENAIEAMKALRKLLGE